MDRFLDQGNWGLLVAGALIAAVFVVVAVRMLLGSRHGQLRHTLDDLAESKKQLRKALSASRRAENRLDRLTNRLASVKPRHVQEAKDLLLDARALLKIAADKVLIAQNHVRRVIHEEFPPDRQERLRAKYLPEDGPDRTPFSF